MKQNQFFKGLKVIELASVLAGPAVGMFFAELGAEVIKIENQSTQGDVTRRWKLPSESAEASYSAYYCSVNWNKKVKLLDLRHQEHQQMVYDLVQESDIVISNFKKASAQKMGMDYETLNKINDKLIYAQLTAYGEADERPAFDVVLQAEAGFLYMTGEAEREPVKMPVALIDVLAAHQLKEGILVALFNRFRTGKGTYVTTSLAEAAIASLANQATNWLMGGHIPQRMGCMHPNIAPYGDIFYAKDGLALVLAVGTERQFKNLCQCLELKDLTEDKRFITNAVRVQHRAALKKLLKPAFLKENRAVLLEKLHAAQVPCGSIQNMQEVFEMPVAKKMILTEVMPDGKESKRVKTVAFSVQFDD